MRKLLLVNIAVAALGAGAVMTDRADATTLGTAAGLRSAVDGVAPIEEITYWGYRYHRRHAYFPWYGYRSYGYYPYRYGYRSYAYYPRRFYHRPWGYRRYW